MRLVRKEQVTPPEKPTPTPAVPQMLLLPNAKISHTPQKQFRRMKEAQHPGV